VRVMERGKTRALPGKLSTAAATKNRLYVTGQPGPLRQFDLATLRERALLGGSTDHLVAVSADGSTIALVGFDFLSGDVIAIKDGASLRTVRTIESRTVLPGALAFSDDGSELAVGAGLLAVQQWNAKTGELRAAITNPHPGPLKVLAYHGRQLVAARDGSMVRVLDAAKGTLLRQWAAHPAPSQITFGAMAGAGELVTVGLDGTVMSWRLGDPPSTPAKPAHFMADANKPPGRAIGKAPWSQLRGAALSPDRRYLALIGLDGDTQLGVMELASGKMLWRSQLTIGHGAHLAVTNDGRVLLAGQDFGRVTMGMEVGVLRAFDVRSGAPRASVPLPGFGPIAVRDEAILIGGPSPVLLDPSTLAVKKRVMVPDLSITSVTAHPTRREFAAAGSGGGTSIISASGELVAMLVSTPAGEYIAATPEGAYRASVDGGRSVAWAFSGPLEAFSFEQFAGQLQRPELVAARLAGETPRVPRLRRPPRVCIDPKAHARETADARIPLRASVAGAREVARVRAFANGRLVAEREIGKTLANVELDVPLSSGDNRISVVAYDRDGFASNPAQLDVHSKARGNKPDLWIVAVGVSRYPKLPSEQQLEFADDDARAISDAWEARAAELFGKVHVTTLIDAEATVEGVEGALDGLSRMRPEDLAVVFMAGHGVRLKDGNMVFLTHRADITTAGARAHGIGWDRLEQRLARTRGRVLMLLDACHSGHLSLENVARNEALAEALANEGRSGVFVFAASKGAQLSYEVGATRGSARGLELAWDGKPPQAPSQSGHGLFTAAVLEAIAGAAPDRDKSGAIEIQELVDDVTERVRAASNGKQTPWVARREMFGDFAIARAR